MLFFILFGAAVGFGLRYLGAAGHLIFWLIVLFQTAWAGLVIAIMMGEFRRARKDQTPYQLPYGGLTEYTVMLTVFAGGLISGYWLTLPWSITDTMIAGISLVLVAGAAFIHSAAQSRHKGARKG